MGTINVKLKSGEIVPMSHPDDWNDEQIEKAIHESFPDEVPSNGVSPAASLDKAEPKESTGISGLASDAMSLGENLLSGGINFANDIPQMTEDLGKDLLERPGKGALEGLGQFAAETADLGKSIVNTPHDLLKYFIKKHLAFDVPIPGTKLHTSDLIPHIPEDTGLEKALNLEPKKEFRAVRAVPDAVALSSALKSIGTKTYKGLTKTGKDVVETRRLEDAISNAEKKKGLSADRQKAFEDSLKTKYSKEHDEAIGKLGEISPSGQEVAINQKTRKIENRRPDSEIPEKEVAQQPEPPDTKGRINAAKEESEAVKRKLLVEKLGVKENPKIAAGTQVQKDIKSVRDNASDLYNSAREDYVGKDIKADNSSEIKEITHELNYLKDNDDLAPGYGHGSSEQKTLENQLKSLESETVKASDILDLQRTLEKMAKDTRKLQHSGKVSDMERTKLIAKAEKFDRQASTLARRLETVGGKEVQAKIKEANKGWKVYKDVTGSNEIGSRAYFKGDIPSGAILDITRNQPGNQFLQSLVESNPELRRQMLAAHVGPKVKGNNVDVLLDPDKIIKSHLEHADMQHVSKALREYKSSQNRIKSETAEANTEKADHKAFSDALKEEATLQAKRQKAQSQSKELTGQIKFHEEAIPKLERRIMVAEKRGENTVKLKEELKQHQRSIEDKNHRLKAVAKLIIHAKGAQGLANKFGL